MSILPTTSIQQWPKSPRHTIMQEKEKGIHTGKVEINLFIHKLYNFRNSSTLPPKLREIMSLVMLKNIRSLHKKSMHLYMLARKNLKLKLIKILLIKAYQKHELFERKM